MLIIYFFLIFLTLKESLGKKQILNAVAITDDPNNQIYTPFIQAFNDYADEHYLDVSINLNLLTKENSTATYEDFGSLIEALLKKKTQKYDLYFYDNLYTPIYGPYLLDVKDLLPKEHVNLYNKNVIEQSCSYKNELVGLPLTLTYTVFYSNKNLLEKYKKRIPKTWDEVIETGQYILEEERKQNNTNLIIYNGLFDESDNGICSIYEFLYSCRESVDAPFPELTSKTAVNALKKIKEVKEKTSSDEIFSMGYDYFVAQLFEGGAIFLKFWIFYDNYVSESIYQMSPLPGLVEGISGSTIAGYNIGIGKGIKQDKVNGAIEALKYLTSKEGQLQFLKKRQIISGIEEVYDDEELCKDMDCPLFKSLQPIARPASIVKNFQEYADKFTKYIYEYLYGNEKPEDVLQKVVDITKIYHMSLSTKDSSIGLIIFIIPIIISLLMLSSLLFLYNEKYEVYFDFLPKPLWIVIIIGVLMILNINITKLGSMNNFICHLYPSILILSSTFILIPILYRLIINFHELSNIILWIYDHKFMFLGIFILLDALFISVFMAVPYEIQTIILDDEKNYERCALSNTFGQIFFGMMIGYKTVIILAILLLIFMEWNINETMYDLRFTVASLYIDILSVVFVFIIEYININNYVAYNLIRFTLIVIESISHYSLMYGVRLLFPFFIKNNTSQNILSGNVYNKGSNNMQNSTKASEKSIESVSGSNSNNASSSVVTKIMTYHYKSSTNSNELISSKNHGVSSKSSYTSNK